ncbi:conserved hypothetical protein [gamma proteobacterium HdN1]|nr:conserved hypothetical protein [gamma proteobacterium HdN1]
MKLPILSFALLCPALQFASPSAANAEVFVIVSAQSGITELSKDHAEKIFLGKMHNFPNGAQAVPLDLKKGPERDEFYKKVTGKSTAQVNSYWARQVFTGSGQPPKEVDGQATMLELVEKNPNVIGYVTTAPSATGVKAVLQIP